MKKIILSLLVIVFTFNQVSAAGRATSEGSIVDGLGSNTGQSPVEVHIRDSRNIDVNMRFVIVAGSAYVAKQTKKLLTEVIEDVWNNKDDGYQDGRQVFCYKVQFHADIMTKVDTAFTQGKYNSMVDGSYDPTRHVILAVDHPDISGHENIEYFYDDALLSSIHDENGNFPTTWSDIARLLSNNDPVDLMQMNDCAYYGPRITSKPYCVKQLQKYAEDGSYQTKIDEELESLGLSSKNVIRGESNIADDSIEDKRVSEIAREYTANQILPNGKQRRAGFLVHSVYAQEGRVSFAKKSLAYGVGNLLGMIRLPDSETYSNYTEEESTLFNRNPTRAVNHIFNMTNPSQDDQNHANGFTDEGAYRIPHAALALIFRNMNLVCAWNAGLDINLRTPETCVEDFTEEAWERRFGFSIDSHIAFSIQMNPDYRVSDYDKYSMLIITEDINESDNFFLTHAEDGFTHEYDLSTSTDQVECEASFTDGTEKISKVAFTDELDVNASDMLPDGPFILSFFTDYESWEFDNFFLNKTKTRDILLCQYDQWGDDPQYYMNGNYVGSAVRQALFNNFGYINFALGTNDNVDHTQRISNYLEEENHLTERDPVASYDAKINTTFYVGPSRFNWQCNPEGLAGVARETFFMTRGVPIFADWPISNYRNPIPGDAFDTSYGIEVEYDFKDTESLSEALYYSNIVETSNFALFSMGIEE